MLSPEEQAIKDKWLADLRSGEYQQAKETLHCPVEGGYCCLGVLQMGMMGRVEREYHNPDDIRMDPTQDFWDAHPALKWVFKNRYSLMDKNDSGEHNFAAIADHIEAAWQ